jgi:hypothetical protein
MLSCSSSLVFAIKSNTNYVPYRKILIFFSHKNDNNSKFLFLQDNYHAKLHDPILTTLLLLLFQEICMIFILKMVEVVEEHDIRLPFSCTKVL